MENKNILAIPYALVPGLMGWLSGLTLPSHESNARVKFLQLLKKVPENIDIKRNEVVNTYAEKDENGKPKMNEQKQYIYTDEKKKEAEEVFKEYIDTNTFRYDIVEENHIQLTKTIKNIVLNTNEKFQGQLAEMYSQWYEIFENIEL